MSLAIKIRASGEESIEILFSDDGCGMSAEVRRQAFDPFFTTRRPTSLKDVVGIVLLKRRFLRVPYQDLVFTLVLVGNQTRTYR